MKVVTDGNYTSGIVVLSASEEPTESGDYRGDSQDDSSETNGNMTVDFGFFLPNPSIDIEKSTNDKDADSASDPYIAKPYEEITWKYVVTNTGNEKIENITVTDDKEGNISCPETTLDVNESMTCEQNGTANQATYENSSTVDGTSSISSTKVTDSDPSNYKVESNPSIDIEKSTNDKDADSATDPYLAKQNEEITWKYVVTNTGDEKIENISVSDDKEGTIDCPQTTLDVNESMSCTKTGTANQANYENNSTVKGTSSITSTELTDDDPSHYIVRYSLGDYVWEDVNKNGLQDTDESGVANIEVELFDSDGNSIATTTTDENGSYKFENLDNGDYQVKFKIPEDYIVTGSKLLGDDDAVELVGFSRNWLNF